VGAWRETVGTEVERNARDDRELAPKGNMRSEKQSESGVEHGNDLCKLHKGLAQVFDLGWIKQSLWHEGRADNVFVCGVKKLLNGTKTEGIQR